MTQISTSPDGGLARLLARRAHDDGRRTFLEDVQGGRVLTYAALAVLARQRAAALDEAAIPPGARVLIDVANPVQFCAAYLGVIAAGRCAVPVNPQAPVAELVRTVHTARPAVMIGDRADRVACSGVPPLRPVRDDDRTGAARHPAQDARPGSVLLLTSGSTGAPKAVELTEDRLLHVARAVARHNRLTPADLGFSPLPLFHINAQVVALLASLEAGAALLVSRRFRRRRILGGRRRPRRNLDQRRARDPDHPGRAARSRPAAAPPVHPVRVGAAARRGPAPDRGPAGVPVVESYGMTEAASQITATPLDGSAPAGSCGRPAGAEAEVRDPAGCPRPARTTGQIWIRGAGVIDGYADGRARDRFDGAGWLNTGDLGYLDDAGFLFLTGRSDDVINRGGELLYPREIEETLIADPAVLDAVVVGRPDPILGQVPVAYVIPARDPGTAAGLEHLLDVLGARCAAELSRFKRPEAIYVVEDLPRAATGKVQRYRLRAGAPAAAGAPAPAS